MAEWLVDASANRHNQTYVKGFMDISGSDLSGNALTVRNGTISVPNNSIPSSAINGGGIEILILNVITGTGAHNTNSLAPSDFWFSPFASADLLASPYLRKNTGTVNLSGAGADSFCGYTMLMKPGVYRIKVSGRKSVADNMVVGFDSDGDNLMAWPNIFTEDGYVPNGGDEQFERFYIVSHNTNLHFIWRDNVRFIGREGVYPQFQIQRLAHVVSSGSDQTLSSPFSTSTVVDTTFSKYMIPGGTWKDPSYSVSYPSYIYASTTDADNVVYLGQSGRYTAPPADMTTEFAYAQRIDPTGAFFTNY